MNGSPPVRHAALVLPLLSFGAGAADAFAFMVLGGIFTANMTGNIVLATLFTRANYAATFAGTTIATGAFTLALLMGFHATRKLPHGTAVLLALVMSAACLNLVVALWWFAPHNRIAMLLMVAGSAAAMALQTVAARRDGIARGATTTFLTGTLADLMQDIADGAELWRSPRWLSVAALPFGSISAAVTMNALPLAAPLLPLCATLICIAAV